MRTSNPLLWPKPPAIWSYGIAVLSVAAALTVSRLPAIHLQDAPVSLFLCAVILSAWFGGVGPGLVATLLSALAFNYYFLPPIHSLGPKPDEITAPCHFCGVSDICRIAERRAKARHGIAQACSR